MIKLIIILICLFLNGCFYQTVSQWDIERVITRCGKLENIVAIGASFEGTERVICKPDNKLSII